VTAENDCDEQATHAADFDARPHYCLAVHAESVTMHPPIMGVSSFTWPRSAGLSFLPVAATGTCCGGMQLPAHVAAGLINS
jgi:hypothetical protein